MSPEDVPHLLETWRGIKKPLSPLKDSAVALTDSFIRSSDATFPSDLAQRDSLCSWGLFWAKEALLSCEAVISESANTLQEMIVVSQGNDIGSAQAYMQPLLPQPELPALCRLQAPYVTPLRPWGHPAYRWRADASGAAGLRPGSPTPVCWFSSRRDGISSGKVEAFGPRDWTKCSFSSPLHLVSLRNCGKPKPAIYEMFGKAPLVTDTQTVLLPLTAGLCDPGQEEL